MGVRFDLQAMGTTFSFTLNQEMLFSLALTGRPLRKIAFNEYRWNCCVIGTRDEYVPATTHKEWMFSISLQLMGTEESLR